MPRPGTYNAAFATPVGTQWPAEPSEPPSLTSARWLGRCPVPRAACRHRAQHPVPGQPGQPTGCRPTATMRPATQVNALLVGPRAVPRRDRAEPQWDTGRPLLKRVGSRRRRAWNVPAEPFPSASEEANGARAEPQRTARRGSRTSDPSSYRNQSFRNRNRRRHGPGRVRCRRRRISSSPLWSPMVGAVETLYSPGLKSWLG